METEDLTPEQIEKRLADRLKRDGREWFGYLTTINASAVATYLQELLEDKFFTTATVYEGYGPKADVRTSNRLRDGAVSYKPDNVLDGKPYVHINWSSDNFV